MQFLVAYQKGNKTLVKLVLDDGNEVWATCPEAVYNFAKKALKEKEEVNAEYEEKHGQYYVSRITKKGAQGTDASNTPPETTAGYTCEECGAELKTDKYKKCYTCNQKKSSVNKTNSEFNCEECGTSLKDGKYKKCYTCNQNKSGAKSQAEYTCTDCGKELKTDKYKKCYTCNQKNPSKSSGGGESSSERADSIKRQSALKSASNAIQVLTGRIEDTQTLGDMVVELYDRFLKKIS